MFTFFRKIRKGLLGEGAVTKYLLYTIGEIALVVIGILIALQVNNWNEERIDHKNEHIYLERLRHDLEADSAYFASRFKSSEHEIDNYTKWVQEAYRGVDSKDEMMQLTDLLTTSSEHITIQNTTYLEMVNAAHINIIQNDSLKISIIDLYRKYETISKHVEEINAYSTKSLSETSGSLWKYSSFASPLFDEPIMYDKSEWAWINNPLSEQFRSIESTITVYYYKHRLFISYFREILIEIGRVSRMIEAELKSNH
jgi:hypothetical protein